MGKASEEVIVRGYRGDKNFGELQMSKRVIRNLLKDELRRL